MFKATQQVTGALGTGTHVSLALKLAFTPEASLPCLGLPQWGWEVRARVPVGLQCCPGQASEPADPGGAELCQPPRWSLRYGGCRSDGWLAEHESGRLMGQAGRCSPPCALLPRPSLAISSPCPLCLVSTRPRPEGAAGRMLTGTASFHVGLCAGAAYAWGQTTWTLLLGLLV